MASMMLRAAIDSETFDQARAAAALSGMSTPEWVAAAIRLALSKPATLHYQEKDRANESA